MMNKRYGRLTVTKEAPKVNGQKHFVCLCDCGTEIVAHYSNLCRGATKSCGCLKRETAGDALRTHGMSKTPIYGIWNGIKKRCYNKTYREYHLYGGRGIRMSREWKSSFQNFYRDMGPRPSPNHSIDRKDNNLGYSKDNCYWATHSEQTINRRTSHFISYRGERMHLKWFAKALDASYYTVYAWIVRQGMSPEEAALRINSRLASEPHAKFRERLPQYK